jgi:hypothetical protein
LAWYPFQDETDGRFRGTAVRAPSADTLPGLVQWDDIQLGAGSSVITNITTSGTQSFDHIGHPDTTGGTIGQVYDGSTVGRLLPSSATPSTTYPIYFDQAGFDHVTLGPASVGPIQFGMSGANYYVATASEPTVAIIPSALGSDTLFLGLAVTCGSYAVVMTSTGKVGVFGFGLIATEVEPALRLLQRGDSLGIEGSARLGGPTNVGNNPGTLQYNPAPRLTQGGNVFR